MTSIEIKTVVLKSMNFTVAKLKLVVINKIGMEIVQLLPRLFIEDMEFTVFCTSLKLITIVFLS